MTLSKGEFGHLFNQLEDRGGFSVEPNTGKAPDKGVMVGNLGSGEVNRIPGAKHGPMDKAETSPSELEKYVDTRASGTWNGKNYFGGWRVDEKGYDSFDVSTNMQGKPTVVAKYGPDVARADAMTSAQDKALYHNQDSVYDVESKNDDGTVPTIGIDEMRKVTGLKSEEKPSYWT